MVDKYTQQRLIQAGVDPETPDADPTAVNLALPSESNEPEAYQPSRSSRRDESPFPPAFDQQRTPWNESDRNLVF